MSELEFIERFRQWDGVSRLDAILSEKKREANFFRIASRVLRVEGVHSDLLAWLLDPLGWHGLQDTFIVPFIEEMLVSAGWTVGDRVSSIVVDKEFSTGEGPIDVLVRLRVGDRPFAVGIENKIDAPLGHDQLERYARGLVTRFPKHRVVLVLLSPDDRDADGPAVDACRFASTTYRRVAAHLRAALAARGVGQHGPGTELARHYLDALRTTIVPEPHPEIDRILQELFTDHQEAWRVIRKRLPSESDENHAVLASALCERLSDKYGPQWRFNLKRGRYVRVFRSAWSVLGETEAETVIGINDTAYAASHYPRVHFRLTARPDDDAPGRWHGIVKLRVNGKYDEQLVGRLRDSLEAADFLRPDMRGQAQFTIDRKQTSKLAAIERGVVPDSVLEWYMRYLGPLVEVVDQCLGKGDNKDCG